MKSSASALPAPRRRTSLRANLSTSTARIAELERERNALLDCLNAACLAAGGSLVIAEHIWAAARRHPIGWEYLPGRIVLRPLYGPQEAPQGMKKPGGVPAHPPGGPGAS